MLNIHWNNYEFNFKKRYLIYFVGNFSPPHRGHISLIEPYFNKKNIFILIHLWGNEEKHNVPLEISLKILEIYLKGVNNIHFEKYNIDNIYKYIRSNGKKIDNLIFIRGNENFDQKIKHYFIETYGEHIKKLRKKGILTEVLIGIRISSSTEMCKDKNLENYFPFYLSKEDKLKIIGLLKNLDLK